MVVTYVYSAIPSGVLRPDDPAMREIEDALGLPNDPVMTSRWPSPGWRWALRWCTAKRLRSVTADTKLLAEVGDMFLRRGHILRDLPIVNVYMARERARRGDRDEAIPLMRAAVDHLFRGTAAGVGHSSDRCSGGDTARSRGRR